MNYCMYEPIHGEFPTCSGNCSDCEYFYHDKLSDIIKEWRIEAKVEMPVLYKYNSFNKTLTICTSRPGYMIGYKGQLIEKYQEKLNKAYFTRKINEIKFIEVENELCQQLTFIGN